MSSAAPDGNDQIGKPLDERRVDAGPVSVHNQMVNRIHAHRKPIRVLLVANYEPDGQESMLRYASWLERTLNSHGYSVTVARPQPFFSSSVQTPVLRKYLGYFDKFLLFPWHLRGLANAHDLVHIADHSNSMYLRTVRKKPNLITCHDLIGVRGARGDFPLSRTGWTGGILQRWILSCLRGARNVLCVSRKTADDLRALTSGNGAAKTEAQLRVVYNALNWSFKPGAALSAGLISRLGLRPDEQYMLHVGGNHWYKNRAGVVRIFAQLAGMEEFSGVKLVLAGQPWTRDLRNLIGEEKLSDLTIEALDVTNPELEALYGNALALLFPSIEEGFGWPILEAQACGCPVITNRRPPMSEVAGKGAILIDPSDIEASASTILLGLKDRERLRAEGFRNLERFDPEAIAEQYFAFYDYILGLAQEAVPNS